MTTSSDTLTVGLAQISPVWLDREKTLQKIISYVEQAAQQGCGLVAFGETILPGYPFWIERTNGAEFNCPIQKEFYARYLDQAVQIESGHLDTLCKLAAERKIAIIVGVAERAADRGGHSIYCSLVFIDASGVIRTVHRKLMPTYGERLTWAPGDGHGLRVHKVGPFNVGGLNCWENWMPLPRAALYGMGEDLHVAIWPGSAHNTADLTPVIAKEGRSFVLSVSGLMRKSDIPGNMPQRDLLMASEDDVFSDGGSCIAGPDGKWIIEPIVGEERLIVATLEHQRVREERQNFDPAGHYSRPDVTKLIVNRERQTTVVIEE
jgi:nitrilase